MMTSDTAPLSGGFENNVLDATACFRVVLDAMARPAKIHSLPVSISPPRGLNVGTVAVLLTLGDMDTPVWLAPECDTAEARAYLRFHAGCPILDDPRQAVFAVMSAERDLSITEELSLGSAEYPDRSATVILESERLIEGEGPLFSGPGFDAPRRFCVEEQPASLWSHVSANQALFPRGLDWILTSDSQLAALPRSTKVEV
ncbi:phosphonate C-P lyase system protein PhnH [uncultured Sneathiella sp.]|uniref:phosphonate C-P lyase system protein PhnH n=1 Tax=uncultured Sneathiella sp. TaxID=879315 RepID=UPI0030EE22E8|tara:strand:- start:16045 stop:16647 length:603 start_codon:yes stop_codon:yes gene_type:complete